MGLLALVALAQLGMFVSLQGRPTGEEKAGTEAEVAAGLAVAEKKTEPPVATLPAELPPEEDPILDPLPAPRRPALVSVPQSVEPIGRPDLGPDPALLPREDLKILVAEATRLRRDGDMAGAVGKLNAALDSLPGHPRLVFEMAATYEAMGMTERAMESYRNVASMGPRAGVLQPIAERRLKDVTEAVGGGSSGGAEDVLYLGGCEESREPDEEGETVVLKFDIHARPGAIVEADKVALPVKFYDRVGGRRTEPSMAETPKVRWTTPPVDWSEPGIETVEVRYHLPASLRGEGEEERKYLGYVVELTYRDSLVDVLARPRRLSREKPPPPPPSLMDPSEPPGLPTLDDPPPTGGLPAELPTDLGGSLLDP